MLKFLFRGKDDAAAKIETQRDAFERMIADLNAAIDALPEKPSVTVDLTSGHLDLVLPERMPDEALALPSPRDETAEAA